MDNFLKFVEEQAKEINKNKTIRIGFPESFEPRTFKAVKKIIENRIARPVLFINSDEIERIEDLDVDFFLMDQIKKEYIDHLYEKRRDKGLTYEQARELIKDPIYLANVVLDLGLIDGIVSGAIHSTAHTIRPALQIIKTKPDVKRVSGVMFMETIKRTLLFSDIAINPNPNSQELAETAYLTYKTAKNFGFKPKIAMLSFSTKGSADHPMVSKVVEATKIAKERLKDSDCIIDGEIQVDAALIKEVANIKCKGSEIQGDANVLIFPDLNAGNIGYKLVQRLGNAKAIGPLLQGLKKPVNDLSRGCSSDDIYYLTAMTVIQTRD